MKNKGNVDRLFSNSISEIVGKSLDFDLDRQNIVYGPPYGFEPPFLVKEDMATVLYYLQQWFSNFLNSMINSCQKISFADQNYIYFFVSFKLEIIVMDVPLFNT
jgi:hypothetical protein